MLINHAPCRHTLIELRRTSPNRQLAEGVLRANALSWCRTNGLLIRILSRCGKRLPVCRVVLMALVVLNAKTVAFYRIMLGGNDLRIRVVV